jgi:quinol-cytochrome oxidoreductase complex cytochrome b subunit
VATSGQNFTLHVLALLALVIGVSLWLVHIDTTDMPRAQEAATKLDGIEGISSVTVRKR